MAGEKLFFLDTDALSYVLRGVPEFTVGVDKIPERNVFIPQPVKNEILTGLENPSSRLPSSLKQNYKELLLSYPVVPYNDLAKKIERGILDDQRARGRVLGPTDVRIASVTIAHQAVLVTNNLRDFARIWNLEIETFFPEQKQKLVRIREKNRVMCERMEELEGSRESGEISDTQWREQVSLAIRMFDSGIDEILR